MSDKVKYTKFKNDIWKDNNIKGHEKLVLIYLISNHNRKYNYSFPLKKQMQDEIGISENTLGKVLKSLQAKGYITVGKHKSNKGWNNIYYIHKYLVVLEKDSKNPQEQTRELLTDNSTNISDANVEAVTEPIIKSANQKALDEFGNINHKLSDEQLELLNTLDTDRFINAINQANKYAKGKYSFNYLMAIYKNSSTYEEPHKNNKGDVVKGAYQQVFAGNKTPKVVTKYHNSFNEHYKDYAPNELEAKLLKMQGVMSFAQN